MGTIKQGILGGFNGKVGTVVGSSWKGITYMRGQAQHVKNPRTAGQIYSRTAFKAVSAALSPIASTLRLTFAKSAGKMSAFNKAVSENYKAAVVDQDGTPVVDYSKLILSKGTIRPFDYLNIDDMSENGRYYLSVINSDNSQVDYEGLIFFIYDPTEDTWFTGVIKQHFHTGETLEFTGVPLYGDQEYLAFACAYDPSTGAVSDPIPDVEAMGG
ncbi:MAG: hypothetical protein IJT45_02120 [Bacteroidales bacterium]|nr:hypothetical protein [Bacteroidales bacterium]